MTGTVFSIEEFSVFDGKGIRTSVFLKGCPLRCSWCHNPEGQTPNSEIVRSPNGCIGCGNCERFANTDQGKITFTPKSAENCPQSLLRVCGESYESEALCARILKNKPILERGGGVTFSGGEPLMQHGFLFECLEILDGKLHTAIQTSGFCENAVFERALSLADYFLYDLKLIDDKEHKRHTGASNKPILSNLSLLAHSKKDFVIRTPLIPTVTDTEENLTAIAELLHSLGIFYIELLPYNKMAGAKYKMTGRTYSPSFDESIECCARSEIFDSFGIKAKIL